MNPESLIHADGRVVAAIDASAYTGSVCRHAAWAAGRLGAPLSMVHVIDPADRVAPLDLAGNLILGEREALLRELGELDATRAKLAQQHGRLLLQQARQLAGVDTADLRLRHGALVDTLVGLEDEVRLFVVGKRGEHADFARGHLGREVERVVRSVHRPLLVASRTFQPIQRVLVAYDGSATTRKALAMVAESPLLRGFDIHLVTVGGGEGSERELGDAARVLDGAGLDATTEVIDGHPDEALAAYVDRQRIDLLVMGAYGHSRIRQLIVGSTTTAVMRNCQVPVLLLR